MKINFPTQLQANAQLNWTPRDLDIFLVLAETGSFRRTAAQVHLSQSAVSGVIVRLEEALLTRLFDRTTRSVHLTQAGKVFLDQVRLLQAQTEEAVRQGEAALWQLYDAIACPTLLLRGADSDLLSPETAQAMTQRGPKARLVEFAGVGHAPTLIAQDQQDAVTSFLLG